MSLTQAELKAGCTYAIGDIAGTGAYRCCRCHDYVAKLTGPEDQIPPCENCGTLPDVRYEPWNEEAVISHGVDELQYPSV